MKIFKQVLAIETSCDDTSVALVRYDGEVLGMISAHQNLVHAPFGGIVPEIASRNHTDHLLPLIDQLLKKIKIDWSQIHGVAVTNRPGLLGSLLVGLMTAKALALTKKIPLIGVHHLEGHLLAPFLRDDQHAPPENFQFPYLALAVSGGHTSLYRVEKIGVIKLLGYTVDDAAGEAFDKFAKLVGLGYPGGEKVDHKAKNGNPAAYAFPRAMIHEDHLNFSFSGLKSSAARMLQSWPAKEIEKNFADLCASYQEAIVDVLLAKIEKALESSLPKLKTVVITGGVSANSRLRERALAWGLKKNILVVVPPLRYCTDNAAMIGYAGIQHFLLGESDSLDLNALAQADIGV